VTAVVRMGGRAPALASTVVTPGVRVRFAPSPTGMFHVGSARSALFNWLFARQRDGTIILRIEDTDETRNRPEWVEGIQSAMAWLGLDWDEGPYFQSARADRHAEAAARLYEQGVAYYCDCSAEDRAARAKTRGGPPGYDGYCRDRGLGPGPDRALRFRVPEGKTVAHDVIRGDVEFDNASVEDFVILKSNGSAVFHLANTVDDLDMDVSHVIRGVEHLVNTPKALMLWSALGAGAGPVFAHLPNLVNEQRLKLSKRRDRVALESFRDQGYLADAMRNYLCLLGWSPGGNREFLTVDEMIAEFRLEDVNTSPAFFDVKKLTAFNQHYLMAMDDEQYLRACAEYFEPALRRMIPLIKERTKTLAEVVTHVDFIFLPEPCIDPQAWQKGVVNVASAAGILADAEAAYADCAWEANALHDVTLAIAEGHGLALGKAQAPIRVAVTGRTVGPPLFESLVVLGRDRTRHRLQSARARLAE
jgi:glutamyl-tRNA synthetase